MNLLKFAAFLALIAATVTLAAASSSNPYSFVVKQMSDSKYFLLKSPFFEMPLQVARDACKSFGLKLAEIHSAETYERINRLFCPPNSFRIYQFWIDIEWTGQPNEYRWMSNSELLDKKKELPKDQSFVDEFFCPNGTFCGDECGRSVVVQAYCSNGQSKVLCSYQNEKQKYALCVKP